MCNEMLAALNAGDSLILAVVLVDGGSVHRPLDAPDPARMIGAEPGFAEISSATSLKAVQECGRP